MATLHHRRRQDVISKAAWNISKHINSKGYNGTSCDNREAHSSGKCFGVKSLLMLFELETKETALNGRCRSEGGRVEKSTKLGRSPISSLPLRVGRLEKGQAQRAN